MSHSHAASLGEEEELECRVCRGPAEEGRPLFKPCKCSGSIAMTHQDCLTSWLEVKGGSGKCDLCSTKFIFAPKYALDAPQKLSTHQVISGLTLRLASKWLPYALRILFVCSVWLFLLPLATAYLYQGWMYRPKSISSRLDKDLLADDLVNGAILTVTIILSFLSLMSLGDFLRFNWQREDEDGEDSEENVPTVMEPDHFDKYENEVNEDTGLFEDKKAAMSRSAKRRPVSVTDEGNPFNPSIHNDNGNDDADEIAVSDRRRKSHDHLSSQHQQQQEQDDVDSSQISRVLEDMQNVDDTSRASSSHTALSLDDIFDAEEDLGLERRHVAGVPRQRSRRILHETDNSSDNDINSDNDSNNNKQLDENHEGESSVGADVAEVDDQNRQDAQNAKDDEALIERMMQMQEDAVNDQADENQDNQDNLLDDAAAADDARFEPRFEPLDRPFEEEQLDNEMQVPFEQIVGLRGPISEVFRNLCWLLAFQAAFIAIFALLPSVLGSFAFSSFEKAGVFSRSAHFVTKKILFALFDLTSTEGVPMDLPFMVNVTITESEAKKKLLQPDHGGTMVFGYLVMAVVAFSMQAALKLYLKYSRDRTTNSSPTQNFQREEIGINNDIRMGLGVGIGARDRLDPDAMRPEEMQQYIAKNLEAAVDCAAAIAKICILVCFKMFALPLLLGTWLDICTLRLFDVSIEDRMVYAGSDIVGFFLVHWVVGITFMLSVTVSVLQLREVLHPDLLAPMIRPQEPQTDLLASLLKDSGWEHFKRMVPSVGIYAALLGIHVWLPCQLLSSCGMAISIPMFRPKFWHVLNPTLQRSFELVVFHLTALSILEKHKNRIGEMQHIFLLKVSSVLGITDVLLPLGTSKFVHVGDLPIRHEFLDDDEFWDEIWLHHKNGATDAFIESRVNLAISEDGRNVSTDDVVLPDSYLAISNGSDEHPGRKLLPTRVGSYRFRKQANSKGKKVVEIWKEVVDKPIIRPPEGWDYLVDGSAVEKGRWAWGKKEKKSGIEARVAHRTSFFPPILENGEFIPQWKTRQFWTKGIPMVMKLAIVVASSWVAVTSCASIAIFTPLFIGRFVSLLLQVPDAYTHDPLLFLTGAIILSQLILVTLKLTKKYQSGSNTSASGKNLFAALPPFRKLSVLSQSLALWLVVCPLLTGLNYSLFFDDRGLSPQVTASKLFSYWPVGFMLLNIWAALCYHGAFRAVFWVKIQKLVFGTIAGGPPLENDGNGGNNRQNQNVAAENAKDLEIALAQNDGGVARLVHVLNAAIYNHEWDKIDRSILLDGCLFPVTYHLASILLIPLGACSLIEHIIHLPSEEILAINLHWCFAFITLIVKLSKQYQSSLKSWYAVCHKAARDHRYLVGQVLLDYRS